MGPSILLTNKFPHIYKMQDDPQKQTHFYLESNNILINEMNEMAHHPIIQQ
jgi:hypothetical protein